MLLSDPTSRQAGALRTPAVHGDTTAHAHSAAGGKKLHLKGSGGSLRSSREWVTQAEPPGPDNVAQVRREVAAGVLHSRCVRLCCGEADGAIVVQHEALERKQPPRNQLRQCLWRSFGHEGFESAQCLDLGVRITFAQVLEALRHVWVQAGAAGAAVQAQRRCAKSGACREGWRPKSAAASSTYKNWLRRRALQQPYRVSTLHLVFLGAK